LFNQDLKSVFHSLPTLKPGKYGENPVLLHKPLPFLPADPAKRTFYLAKSGKYAF
jgi:hypothetical protein